MKWRFCNEEGSASTEFVVSAFLMAIAIFFLMGVGSLVWTEVVAKTVNRVSAQSAMVAYDRHAFSSSLTTDRSGSLAAAKAAANLSGQSLTVTKGNSLSNVTETDQAVDGCPLEQADPKIINPGSSTDIDGRTVSLDQTTVGIKIDTQVPWRLGMFGGCIKSHGFIAGSSH